jgi:hypothetical protein
MIRCMPACRAAALTSIACLCLASCRGIRSSGTQQPESILGAFAPPTPAEAAAWAADEFDPDKRYRGMLLLANAPFGGEPVYVEMYASALDDEDALVRAAAVRALSFHGSPEHVPRIVKQFDDEDRMLRWECARALQRLHNPEAIPALIKHASEKGEADALVRTAASDALGQYPQPRVLDSLIACLGDRDLAVNEAALRSLRTLTGQDFGDDLRAWVAWQKSTDHPFAARQTYVYPVFHRDKNWVEWILPIFRPPNEIAGSPAGLTVEAAEPATEDVDSAQSAPAPVRNN